MSTYSDLLTQTCVIKRRASGNTDLDGLPEETFTTVSSGISCLIQQKNESVTIESKGRQIISRHILFYLYGEDLQEDDLIILASKTYSVVSADEDVGGQAHHGEAYLVLVE